MKNEQSKNIILSGKQDDNLIYLSRWQAIRWHLYVYADISGKCLGCGVVRNTAGSGRGRLGVDYIQFLYSAFLPAFVSRFVFCSILQSFGDKLNVVQTFADISFEL